MKQSNLLEATHMVSSVYYGAEVYCIVAQEMDCEETDRVTRQEMEEKLSKLSAKWRDALYESETLEEFKKHFNYKERHLISRLKCRLYADLQARPLIECGFFESYNHSFELMKSIFTVPKEAGYGKAIPIAVQLCPLKVLLDPDQVKNTAKCYEVCTDAVAHCWSTFSGLKRTVARAEKMSNVDHSVRHFVDLILKYHELLQTN